MKVKTKRLEALRLIISSNDLGSQEEIMKELNKAGFTLTQATLSRDMKQLKIAKAASMNGNYVYVLPNETMYRRVSSPQTIADMLRTSGFLTLNFSGNMAVIRTRPGYASSIAYNIDNADLPDILGTIAGDDTIFLVIKEGVSRQQLAKELEDMMADSKHQTDY